MNTSPSKIAERRERTHEEAMAIIDAERRSRIEKTEKLRAIRLAKANAEAAPANPLASNSRHGIRLLKAREHFGR